MMRRTRKGENEKGRKGAGLVSFFLFVVLLATGCGANDSILKSGKDTPQANAGSEKTPFARELDAVRTADFSFIYVLRRKDGGKIGAEDRSVIKLNTDGIPRRVAADDDKAFILGSNFQLPPKNMMALYDRFAVENYSPPPAMAANTNANTGK